MLFYYFSVCNSLVFVLILILQRSDQEQIYDGHNAGVDNNMII